MYFLEISSKGMIEREAFSLIGASTKRGDSSKIGMFGSGLKYAISSILRQEIPFIVFSGGKEIKFSTQTVEFGGKFFNQIYIDNKETSFTDSMGTEDWKGAFPYVREIYSNALDNDPDATIKMVKEIKPNPENTTFYIQETPQLLELWNNFDDYFLDREKALYDSSLGQLHNPTEKLKVFRHGILAHTSISQKSIFNYDIKDLDINESRVAKNTYQMSNQIGQFLESIRDKRLLRRWINGVKGANFGLYEHDCILSDWHTTSYNPDLIEVILENKYYPVELSQMLDDNDSKGRIALPINYLKRFLQYAPDLDCIGLTSNKDSKLMKVEKIPSVQLVDKVNDALSLLKKTSYVTRLENPINYCVFSDSKILGLAEDKTIWLSTKLDVYSVDEIAKIIIEEQEHLITGFNDETRDFQNHLFSLFYNSLMI